MGAMALDALDGVYRIFSPGGHRDICDPPYMDAETLKVAATSLWALVVAAVTIFSIPHWRTAVGFTRKLVILLKFYAVAVLPAVFLIFQSTW
ncbi:hypothetical protein [Roseobacter sp. CCS2]|uniref:hypothetical protein n=1 Tax=Roseobacter sp. CCS2 TaxID=391593 RepID=UPI0000F400A3|nr:hypothetical protein [Roseobacter sp. CCS2]EBA13709.1 hypothetical protein RCCS2_07469 [Roseobacter sp. CCS2]